VLFSVEYLINDNPFFR